MIHKKQNMGDVDMDGEFALADLILFRKWLLAVPDVEPPDPKAADFTEDGNLNVIDYCIMKSALNR